ncbi:MAG TPA: M23 family metallopeptidase [Sandaracinaceae bacterium LLY-WYZ-13_1]|nr:M23 family metallopeptidase [Sandaracinaceae bacterium LLY-WYZ-13_1]
MRRLALPFATILLSVGLAAPGCAAHPEPDENLFETLGTSLTSSQRRARATRIRDEAARHGLTNGWVLAAIADAETNLAHCWSEATWACQGPASADCGGGPVIAGAADGPCSAREGGLGMFQFDGGDHDDTLRRDGERVLTVAGSVAAAVDFVVAMLQRSRFVDVSSRAEALAFANALRPDGVGYHAWIQTVTGYYNGCLPGACSVYESRYARYDDKHRDLVSELGEDFWFGATPTDPSPSDPPPSDPPPSARSWGFPTADARWLKEFNVRNPALTSHSSCFGVPLGELTHAGEDWGRPAGSPVLAIGDGEVVAAYHANYPGDVIVIEHRLTAAEQAALGLATDTIYSQYGHVSREVAAGDTVRAGDRIATIWSWPGNDHLHWEVRDFEHSPICGSTHHGPGYSGPGTDATAYGWIDPADAVATLAGLPSEPSPAPTCGDGTCDAGEDCASCASDCGGCGPACGDGTCDAGEDCASCASDCGSCAPTCGDGTCDAGEDCASCGADCGSCGSTCGVPGHEGAGENGDPCSSPESWRCAYSSVNGAWSSQVCRDGRWLIYRLNPADCGGCCGSYSGACG